MNETIELFKTLLGKQSYFNAAEGNYGQEGEARNANKVLLKEVALELFNNGIDLNYIVKSGTYLVNEYDYMPK